MRLVLVSDTFPPFRTSGALQLWDLSHEFVRQGHSICVLLPTSDQSASWRLESRDGIQVMYLRAFRTKDIGYVWRTLAELLMPFAMLRNFRKSPLALERWDGVLWYSPSIFHGPLVSALKKSSVCKSYLIIRDIFPEWAVDMGLMRRNGLVWRFFDTVARYQYSVADVIGVQTPGNGRYFARWLEEKPSRQLEVLQNWLNKPPHVRCSIRVNETLLAGRRVLVYAGNMGIAQGLDILLELAERLQRRTDIGFLFVGRGRDTARLKVAVQFRQLDNVMFFDEIEPEEIPNLYAQCSAGIVALDPRHKTHNIPGKFLTYMQCGLPVLANINAGNDLAQMIRKEQVGQVCDTNQVDELLQLTEKLLEQIEMDTGLSDRCYRLFEREFSVKNTVKQIAAVFSS
jgi:glycosyltransferase involved in cell wall biosynthesis